MLWNSSVTVWTTVSPLAFLETRSSMFSGYRGTIETRVFFTMFSFITGQAQSSLSQFREQTECVCFFYVSAMSWEASSDLTCHSLISTGGLRNETTNSANPSAQCWVVFITEGRERHTAEQQWAVSKSDQTIFCTSISLSPSGWQMKWQWMDWRQWADDPSSQQVMDGEVSAAGYWQRGIPVRNCLKSTTGSINVVLIKTSILCNFILHYISEANTVHLLHLLCSFNSYR